MRKRKNLSTVSDFYFIFALCLRGLGNNIYILL